MANFTDEEEKNGQPVVPPQIDPSKSTTDNVNTFIRNNDESTTKVVDDINDATDAYAKSLKASNEQQKSAMNEHNKALQDNYAQLKDMISGWVKSAEEEKEAQRKRNEQSNRRDYQVRIFGGIAEAAAAIVNLVGTAHGASPMRWQSPQDRWAQRADQYRRERDAKLAKLDAQLKALDRQKAQLDFTMGKEQIERDYKTKQAEISGDNEVAKAIYGGRVKAAQVQKEGNTRNISLAMQGLNTGRQEKSQKETESYRDFQRRLYGYDPETGLFYNSETKQFDRKTPEHIKGTPASKTNKSESSDEKSESSKSKKTEKTEKTETETNEVDDFFKNK